LEERRGDIDEERRLLYVGMTRASGQLVLTHARKRMIYGKQQQLKRSPFLGAVENHLLEETRQESRIFQDETDGQLTLFE
jgi:superfamily I DNA/RNA helicase